MSANTASNALAKAKAAALAKAKNTKPAIDVEQPVANDAAPVEAVEHGGVEAAAPAEKAKRTVPAGLVAWQEARRAAKAQNDQQLSNLKAQIDSLRAKGAAMTDDDKAAVAAWTAQINAITGKATGTDKLKKMANDAQESVAALIAELAKYQQTEAAQTRIGDAVALMQDAVLGLDLNALKRKPVAGFTAKPKVEWAVGMLAKLTDAGKKHYADVLDDVSVDFRVTKVTDKNVAVMSDDGARLVLDRKYIVSAE